MYSLVLIFTAVVLIQTAETYQSEDVLQSVDQINTKFFTQTNVIFDFDDIPEMGKDISKLSIPNIIITGMVNFKIVYKFNKDILAIALISRNSTEIIKASLSKVLQKIHDVNVLFVLLDSTNPNPILKWAWKNGFQNSLTLCWTKGQKQLFEFEPYPKFILVGIKDIIESSLQKDTTNMHRYPIRTTIPHAPSFSFRYRNRQGKLTNSGTFFNIFDLFVKMYNATIKEVILSPPIPLGYNFLDSMKAVNEGKIDIELYPILQFKNEYLCTDTYFLLEFYLMVPFAKHVDESMYIILPFKCWTWVGLYLAMLMFAIGIYVGYGRVTGKWDFGLAFLEAFGGILNVPTSFRTENSRVLIAIFALLSVSGLMLSNFYLAQHATFLSTFVYEKQINTIEDAIASGLPIASTQAEYDMCYVMGCSDETMRKVKIIGLEEQYRNRVGLNTSVMDVVNEQRFLFLAHQQKYLRKPLVKLIKTPILTLAPAFVMPFTSPYRKLYSMFMLRVLAAGIYKKINSDLNNEGIASGLLSFIREKSAEIAPLSLMRFKIAWIALAVGHLVSGVCCLLEVVWFTLKNRQH